MKRKTRSILSELQNLIPEKDRASIVESRASHIIESAINLLDQIKQTFPQDQAEELEKRFLSSIKNKDPKRFLRGIKKLRGQHD